MPDPLYYPLPTVIAAIVRASLGMVVGALAVLVLAMIPGLQFLNVWYAIGAGALCAVGDRRRAGSRGAPKS